MTRVECRSHSDALKYFFLFTFGGCRPPIVGTIMVSFHRVAEPLSICMAPLIGPERLVSFYSVVDLCPV